jgi:hypothetical protein
MKTFIIKPFLSFLLFSMVVVSLKATPVAVMYWADPSSPGVYSTNSTGFCGAPLLRNFFIDYNYCPEIGGVDCGPGGCGANHYRYTFSLYRSGQLITQQVFTASSSYARPTFYNIPASQGNYYATVKFEKRADLCTNWVNVSTTTSNTINISKVAATPHFTLNSYAELPSGAQAVCSSNIRVNAAASTCETSYYLGIMEIDQWGHRSGDYEIGVWLSGAAPDNIDLQQFATTYSVPPYFTGSAGRQGNALLGGNMPNGAERFYYVSVCTSEPNWTCQTAFIRVDVNCRTIEAQKDNNLYTLFTGNEVKPDFQEEIAFRVDALIEPENNEYKVFPNPASSRIQVEIPADKFVSQIKITNSLGQLVKDIPVTKTDERVLTDLDVSDLMNGIYFVELIGAEEKWNSKLVINK